MVRRWSVLGCAGVMLLGLALPAAAEEKAAEKKAAEDKATLSGLKSTKAAELGDVRGSIVVPRKTIAQEKGPGVSGQEDARVTGASRDTIDNLDDDDVTKLFGGSGAGLTSGVGGAYGSDLRGFTSPVARSVNPNRF